MTKEMGRGLPQTHDKKYNSIECCYCVRLYYDLSCDKSNLPCHASFVSYNDRMIYKRRCHNLTISIRYRHDDVIKWKHLPPFVRGIHRSPVNSPHQGQWRRALIFSVSCARINGWVNNREGGDLRRIRAHYDVIVMVIDITYTYEDQDSGEIADAVINSLALGYVAMIKNVTDQAHGHFFWHYSQVNVSLQHCFRYYKSLPEPMMTQIFGAIWHHHATMGYDI